MSILDLLQQYQGAQGQPSMLGPIMGQNPQSLFRAPAPMSMAMPQPQQSGFDLGQGMGLLGAGLNGLNKNYAPGMEPNRTAGDRDLNGYGSSPANPFGNPNAVPTIYNPGGGTGGGLGAWLSRVFG